MGRGERGCEARRAGADDDDVPVREVVEIDALFELGDVEVRHSRPDTSSRAKRRLVAGLVENQGD